MRIRLAVVVAISILQGGCRVPTEPDGLRVVTSVSPRTFHPGSVAEILTTITNHGIAPRTIGTTGVTGCGAMRVTSPAGDDVGRLDADCDASLVTVTLQRGEQIVLRRPWRGDVETGEFPQARTLLPPGRYLLRTQIGVVAGLAGTRAGTVDARPVAVTLIP